MLDKSTEEYNTKLIQFLEKEGYENLRVLEDGTVCATLELIFTRSICIGLNYQSWEKRFCFSDRELAVTELNKLKTGDDEPVGYVARRNG